MEAEGTPLEGPWSLLASFNQTEDGHRIFPPGENAMGWIGTPHEGYVFVHMMANGRTFYSSDDPFGGTLQEGSAAFKPRVIYAGTHEFLGGKMVHRNTHASCACWLGTP